MTSATPAKREGVVSSSRCMNACVIDKNSFESRHVQDSDGGLNNGAKA